MTDAGGSMTVRRAALAMRESRSSDFFVLARIVLEATKPICSIF